MSKQKNQQSEAQHEGLSIVAAIRLDQAKRGLRVVSKSAIRKLERQAQAIARETPFTVLAGLDR